MGRERDERRQRIGVHAGPPLPGTGGFVVSEAGLDQASIENGEAVAAGLFGGGGVSSVVPLTVPVPEGAGVAVTLEQAGGVEQPTRRRSS